MVRLEKKRTDRDALSALLDGSRHILAAALLALYGKPPEGPDAELCRQLGRRLGRQKLINTIQMLQTYRGPVPTMWASAMCWGLWRWNWRNSFD